MVFIHYTNRYRERYTDKVWPWTPPSLTSHASAEPLHVSVAAPAMEMTLGGDNTGITGMDEVR